MTITINDPKIESRLSQDAMEAGLTVNDYVHKLLQEVIEHMDPTVANFDALFGTSDWQQMNAIADPRERKRFLHGLYFRQLRETAGARYVRSFEMRNDKGVADYFLFFATNSATGMIRC